VVWQAVRIVAGSLGGRRLRAPHGEGTRPTSDKVREALFNILGPPPPATYVLDVFAGSGALGLEAISRGAAHATLIDHGKPQLVAIRGNVADLGLAGQVTVLAGDAVALAARHAPPAPWRWIFVDPPYASDLATRAVAALPAAHLAADAVVIIEHDRRHAPADTVGSLVRTDERRYGDTLVSFYRAARAPETP
jgi:16S rRNA (guanine(966)-N(2))-methyltransferase RsmD